MKQNETKKVPKSSDIFYCEKCDFTSSRESQYVRHLLTKKHKNETKVKQKSSKKYECFCKEIFNSRTTMWRHKKYCDSIEYNNSITPNLILELIKDNKEMKKIILDQNYAINNLAQNSSITNNSHNVNSMNNTFNLQIYLNESCKDAMNINDFVSNIKIDLNDLENTGKKGYIEGISNIILKNLNNLKQCFRPIHCSDYKREILYIKNNDEWMKETENKPILTNAIKTIANENIKQIQNWREKNPDCINSESKKNNIYLKIVSNSMNGSTTEESEKNINKIISNVAKETIIDKNKI